ncbi:MAG: hypothetical protein KAH62_07765 [Desulfobacula sp.]|nr:hypothetical protein [Desulfobacula sp.]
MMAKRLSDRGIEVTGYTAPGPKGMSLCKLEHSRKVLMEEHADGVKKASKSPQQCRLSKIDNFN